MRDRLHDSFFACASFAGAVFLFEALCYAPGIRPGALSYLAVVAALTLALVCLVAAAAAVLAGRAAPQAALITLVGITVFGADAELGPVNAARAVAVVSILALALLLDRELRLDPNAAALLSAVGVCLAFRVWPRWSDRAAFHPLHDGRVMTVASEALVFAGCLAAGLLYSAARRRIPGRPRVANLALTGLVLTAIVVTASDAGRALTKGALPARAGAGGAQHPSILLLVLDTVGANRLSIYGHQPDTTPELQRFLDGSGRAVLFPLAFSAAPWTGPSHASLFSGVLPSEHGIGRVGDAWRRPRHRLLSETLREQGYRTAAVIANPVLGFVHGLLDGFDVVVRWPPVHRFRLTPGETLRDLWLPELGTRATKGTPSAQTINRSVVDLVRQCDDGPCFVFANYMDAHAPYAPLPAFAGSWSGRWAPVDSEATGSRLGPAAARHDEAIRSLDSELGNLLGELAASGVLDRWWIVITADHGEAFGEHGYTAHGKGLHVELTKVPLVIQPPAGIRVEARADPVSLLDVATTIAAVGGVEGFGAGADLRSDGAIGHPTQMEFAGRGNRTPPGGIAPSRAVVLEGRQLIESMGRTELYDLGQDPKESRDLASSDSAAVERLGAFLPHGYPAASGDALDPNAPPREPDDDTRRQLRALGYVD